MATLICDQCPVDAGGSHQNRTVIGATEYQSSILRAFVQYGTWDRYIFIERNSVHSSARESYPWLSADNAARYSIVSLPELMTLRFDAPIVLMTPNPMLHGLYGLQHLLRRYDAPCVGLIHSLNRSGVLKSLLGSLLRRSRSVDAMVCSSTAGRIVIHNHLAHLKTAAGLANDYLPFDCPVIPLGIEEDYFDGVPREEARQQLGLREDEVALTSVGRFSSRTKGDLRPLLIAFAELHRARRAPLRLFLAGDDSQEHETRSLITFCRMLDIEPFVSIRPQVSHAEKLRLLAAADVFIAPSDNVQETFGLSVVEAMAAGVPVVAPEWDGFRDTVAHGETGLLVPILMPAYEQPIEALTPAGGTLADSLTAQTTIIDMVALVRALTLLIENPAFRKQAGEAARTRARTRYHFSVVVAQHERLWTELLARTPPAGDGEPPQPLFSYPRSMAFSHYPTALLSREQLVALTPLGQCCLEADSGGLLAGIAGNERMFRVADLEYVLQLASRCPSTRIEAIISNAVDARRALVLQSATARLLKYGALRLVATEN